MKTDSVLFRLHLVAVFVAIAVGTLFGAATGCRSIYYYRVQTMEKARVYALERLKHLDETQRAYIRYNQPYFLESRIFARESKDQKSKKDLTQTCVVWDVPGLEKSIAVVGVGERRLNDWEPIRLVFKNFEEADKNKVEALRKARKYVTQKMPYLSTAETNRVRFAYPEIRRSDFDIETKREVGPKFEKIALVWNGDEENDRIVVIGFGREGLGDWNPETGRIYTRDEVEANVRPGLITPY
jgi:hypothetical protein